MTQAGREVLATHLREIADPHRAYRIRFDGDEWSFAAKSHGKARYQAYLNISDCWDLTFGQSFAAVHPSGWTPPMADAQSSRTCPSGAKLGTMPAAASWIC